MKELTTRIVNFEMYGKLCSARLCFTSRLRSLYIYDCSEIHSKNIENMLSKLYIGTYCIVHDVIKYTQNIASVHST